MADRAISALTQATEMTSADLFAISQGGQAKKVTWETFYTYLAEALDGHGGVSDVSYTAPTGTSLDGTLTITLADGTSSSFTVTNGRGITSISKTGTSGLNDTYTIAYNNGTSSTFVVKNGRGITGFTKSTSGLVDTYTISYNDGTTSTIVVTNGKEISDVTKYYAVSDSNVTVPSTWSETPQTMTAVNRFLWSYETYTFNDSSTIDTTASVIGAYGDTGQNWYVWIKWAEEEPTSDSDMSNVPDNWIGIYSGTASTAPTTYTSYTWFEYKGETGDTGTSITGVVLDSTSGLSDVYRVNFSNGAYTTFTVTNGSSIDSITKTGTDGLVDTYTVLLTNGDTTTFNVTNGKGIASITEVDVTHQSGHTDVYRINFNDGDTYTFSIYNGTNGTGSVSTVDGIQSANQNVELLLIGNGPPTTSTTGILKQRYFDRTNSVLYICTGVDTSTAETSYTWQGTSVTVDSVLSSMSTNPVQNATLTGIIGTSPLNTTAQTLTGAINEHESDISTLDTALSGKVSKSGDTMSGNLTIGDSSPGVVGINSAMDVTDSSYTRTNSTGFRLQDKNGKNVAIVSDRYLANGSTGLWLTGWKTVNGSNFSNNLSLYVDKNGNRVVDLSPAPWRSALELGEIVYGSNTTGNVSIPNGTATEFSSLTLTTGVWVVVACADWEVNAVGYRQIATSDITNPNRSTATTTVGLSGKEAYQQLTMIRPIAGASSNIVFYALQNSGAALKIYPYVYAVRVG